MYLSIVNEKSQENIITSDNYLIQKEKISIKKNSSFFFIDFVINISNELVKYVDTDCNLKKDREKGERKKRKSC